MRRRPRQISLKECYDILKLKKDADTADLKRAYRRRAFELHPDLNPGNPDASKDFQLLNEAYVALSAVLKHEDTVRTSTETSRAEQEEAKARAAKDEAEENERQASARAEKEARQNASAESENARQADTAGATGAGPSDSSGATGAAGKTGATDAGPTAGANRQEQGQARAKGPAGQQGAQNGYSEHDVLRDLLTDPFARRVFEDIYSELNRQHQTETPPPPPPKQEEPAPEQPKAKPAAAEKRNVKLHQSNLAWGTTKWNKEHSKGVTGMVKGWLRRQIDEEQSLTLPSANLAPGKRIRLQIRQALSGELKTVEITLPPDFAVGKPIRLRGLGKRVGPWQGDLYLILTNE